MKVKQSFKYTALKYTALPKKENVHTSIVKAKRSFVYIMDKKKKERLALTISPELYKQQKCFQ